LNLGSHATLVINGAVVLNVSGEGVSGNPPIVVDTTGGAVSNTSLKSYNFQVNYAGTGEVRMAGGGGSAAIVDAPEASVKLTGGSNFYGSVIGKTVKVDGGTGVIYDRSLQNRSQMLGPYMLSSFTWSKY